MKSVLISINPKWCEKIASGEKTIEVRKSAPKEVPFKCYIYMTQGTYKDLGLYSEYIYKNRMKVIGEFVCDMIEPFTEYKLLYDGNYVEKETRVPTEELLSYKGKNDFLYGWHISDLEIYDKPKELSEFFTIVDDSYFCRSCVWRETPIEEMPCKTCTGERKYLYRPPQSWQYVEE